MLLVSVRIYLAVCVFAGSVFFINYINCVGVGEETGQFAMEMLCFLCVHSGIVLNCYLYFS